MARNEGSSIYVSYSNTGVGNRSFFEPSPPVQRLPHSEPRPPYATGFGPMRRPFSGRKITLLFISSLIGKMYIIGHNLNYKLQNIMNNMVYW